MTLRALVSNFCNDVSVGGKFDLKTAKTLKKKCFGGIPQLQKMCYDHNSYRSLVTDQRTSLKISSHLDQSRRSKGQK